jgi:hypothetical protein
VLFLWAREIGGIEGEEGRGRGVEDQIGSMVNGMFLPQGANHSTHTHIRIRKLFPENKRGSPAKREYTARSPTSIGIEV